MKYLRVLILLIIVSTFWSCDTMDQQERVGESFFDLTSFFEKEYVRLGAVKKVIKTAVIDGKVEEKTVKNIDFNSELALFADSDINKISWLDKYEVDSIMVDNHLNQLVYKAKDDKLKTNQLSISFEKDQVKKIVIIRKTESIAATLEQKLIYEPSRGYSIESSQQTSLSQPYVLGLDVRFIF